MNTTTCFEDMSNDLLMEIFDYFHALDLFEAFSFLNHRITLILSSSPLHIVISKLHCYRQINVLSSYLSHHAHQVVSVSFQDELRDFSSVINYFFTYHTFENLRSCKFYSISLFTSLENIIEKLAQLNNLVSFRIYQPNDISLLNANKHFLTKTFLTHQSPKLHSIELSFRYHYPKFMIDIDLNLTITSLRLIFHGSTFACSIDSILPILYHFRVLRVLRISISNKINSHSQPIIIPTVFINYEQNPPISLSMRIFQLTIETFFTCRSLNFILYCMPNLRRFFTTIIFPSSMSTFSIQFLQGHLWKELLETNTPYLDVFEIFLQCNYSNKVQHLDNYVNSFDYFERKFENWHIAIYQSQQNNHDEKQHIHLHGSQHLKRVHNDHKNEIEVALDTMSFHTNITKPIEYSSFYSNCRILRIHIPVNMKDIVTTLSNQLFNNINHLTIDINSSMQTCWTNILNLFQISFNFNKIDQKECANKVLSLVNLSNITKLSIQSKNLISQLYFIAEILLAASRVIQFEINNLSIFSSILYDNVSLTPFFNRIQSLYLQSEYGRMPLKYASKLVQCFPSLIHLEFDIDSLHTCISILNIVLDRLPKLAHMIIHFYTNNLLTNGTYSMNDILQACHQSYSFNINSRDEVIVRINENLMNVYISGCSICANVTHFI